MTRNENTSFDDCITSSSTTASAYRLQTKHESPHPCLLIFEVMVLPMFVIDHIFDVSRSLALIAL